jgi:hypothetical protein
MQNNIIDHEQVEIIMAYFAIHKKNNPKNNFFLKNFEPAYSSIRKLYPEAIVHIYTDLDVVNNFEKENIKITKITSIFNCAHPRYGWRSSDYYRIYGLLKSKSRVAIYLDSDLKIISNDFKVLEIFTKNYGMAIASNPRLMNISDYEFGSDVDKENPINDPTKGLGYSFATGLISLDTTNQQARNALQKILINMEDKPQRLPVVLYHGFFQEKFIPYLLTPQWCICSPKVLNGRHLFDYPIVLHVDHKDVLTAYRRSILIKKIKENLFFKKILLVLKRIKKFIIYVIK